jgi:hypothetical protein
MKYWISWTIVLAATGALVGCGSGSSMPLVPVEGVVTFGNGPPPKRGTVNFSLFAGTGVPGLPNRPASAEFDEDGLFSATTFEPGDGLLPGKYRVSIECMDGIPEFGVPFDEISFVPSNYQPPELVVEEGKGTIKVTYDVPPNPKKKGSRGAG